MKTSKILFLACLLSLGVHAYGQHSSGHINAGATDSNSSGGINAGDKLYMYFEPNTQTTSFAYNAGGNIYGADGYLNDGFRTFTSLHQSTYPSEDPFHDTLGAVSESFIVLNLQSITGPTGAKFAFYETGATDPIWIYTLGTGITLGNGSMDLTETDPWFDGTPSDPYGHFHGRRFAVDTFGTYTVNWVLHDTESGTTGMLDSDSFTTTYIAIPEPSTVLLCVASALVFAMTRILRRRKSAERA